MSPWTFAAMPAARGDAGTKHLCLLFGFFFLFLSSLLFLVVEHGGLIYFVLSENSTDYLQCPAVCPLAPGFRLPLTRQTDLESAWNPLLLLFWLEKNRRGI